MFKTKLEDIIIQCLNNLLFSKEFISEDDFRDQLSTELKKIVSEANISIPSTRSSKGDIEILGRKCEIKYLKQTQKQKTKIQDIIDDLESLRSNECDFVIVAFHMDNYSRNFDFYLNDIISFPAIKDLSKNKGTIFNNKIISYKAYSVFFAGAYLTDFIDSNDRANKAPKYLKFENNLNIRRTVLLEINKNEYLCSNVIGSCEDGMICYLYSNTKNLKKLKGKFKGNVEYQYKGNNYFFAKEYMCDFISEKSSSSKNILNSKFKLVDMITYQIFD